MGYEPFDDDWGHVSAQAPSGQSIMRLQSDDGITVWSIVARDAAGLRVFAMPENWETFLRARFTQQFGLTVAELDVLVAFAQGSDLRTIADQRNSSYNTVRNQIRSSMEKLSVYSQPELASAVTRVATLASVQTRAGQSQSSDQTNVTRTHLLADGRQLEYNLHGEGSDNMVVFHCLAGGKHLSDETIAWANARNFRTICPSRAGFAGSDSSKRQGMALLQAHIDDTAALVDAVGGNGSVMAVSYGTGFASALSYAISNPQRCRSLIAINPIPPREAIGKANNLKGLFKVGFLAAKYAPAAFKALPYFHARMNRATRDTRTSPTVLPDYDLKTLETPSGYTAFLKNAADTTSNSGDAMWREASLCLSNWLPKAANKNSIPQIIWVETTDSPFTKNRAFEPFRESLGADLVAVDRTFPIFISQLPAAFAVREKGVLR